MEPQIRTDLREWAEWYVDRLTGWQSKTGLYKVMLHGAVAAQSYSCIEPGIDAPCAWMRRLVLAMNRLRESESGQCIQVVQLAYLLGEGQARAELKMSARTFQRYRARGENLLALETGRVNRVER